MELWIRSQDKNVLQKTNALFIANTDKNIFSIIDNENMTKYGTYSTKERTLEILDEIQNLIQQSMNFIINQHIDFDNDGEGLIGCNILKEEPKIEKTSNCIVYEMPED